MESKLHNPIAPWIHTYCELYRDALLGFALLSQGQSNPFKLFRKIQEEVAAEEKGGGGHGIRGHVEYRTQDTPTGLRGRSPCQGRISPFTGKPKA